LPDWLDTFSAGGITGVAEIMASPGFDLARPWIYRTLEEEGALPLRVHVYAPIFSVEDVATVAAMRDDFDGDLVTFGGGKVWVDGSMGTAEAWMSEEVLEGGYGSHYFDEAALAEVIQEAEADSLPLKMHANGDAAVTAALDALEAAGPLTQQHCIEHAVLVAPGDEQRMAELGVVASVQPAHYLGARLSDTADAWGSDRFGLAYDERTLQDAGVPLALGTDWPVWPAPDVAINAWAATELAPGHTLTIDEALDAYAAGSARAVGAQGRLGCLDPGCAADIVLYGHDLSALDPSDVSQERVEQVWLAGQRVR
jgi:hypothetical protein